MLEVLISVTPESCPGQSNRQPLNLALVLDRSGSMAGEKLRLTREAAARAVSSMAEGDTVSIVLFDQEVNVLVRRAQVEQKTRALALLERVVPGGQTALFDGWRQGGQQVLEGLDKQQINRVVLLTDGEANIGETGIDPICTAVSQLVRQGVQTTTLGFGSSYNEELLSAMAASGDGNHFFVEKAEQLGAFFELELAGLRATQGRNVRLSLSLAGGISMRWLGQVHMDDRARVKLSDLVSLCPLSRMVELTVPAGVSGYLATVILEWQGLDGAIHRQESVLERPAVSAQEWERLPQDQLVLAQGAVARLAELRQQAMDLFKYGRDREGLELLNRAGSLPHLPAEDLLDLQELIEAMRRREYSSGHKKAAMSGHSYRSGHGVSYYRKGAEAQPVDWNSPFGELPLRQGRLLRTPPSGGARAWNRVEGMLRGLFYGERLGLGPRPPLGEASSLTLATLECLRRGPFNLNQLLNAWSQAPVLSPSPSLSRMRQRHGEGRDWSELGGDTAGCGALRRMAPLLVPYCGQPDSLLWRDVALSTAVTHKNNAALVASLGAVKLLWEMLACPKLPLGSWYLQQFVDSVQDLENGRDYPMHTARFRGWRGSLCQFLALAVPEARAQGLSVSQVMRGWGSGAYVLEMIPNWLYILERHAHEPEVAMSMAVTDSLEPHSLGALVGAAIGALHGPRPSWLLPDELEEQLSLTRDRWF
ncbi:MAG: VWA domain-containing protein [Vulcanimicrobiota bacterium]